LQRIDVVESNLSRLYGDKALAVFRVRHYASVAGLWLDEAAGEGLGPAERKAYLGVAATYLGIAVRSVKFVPAGWTCWKPSGCNPSDTVRAVEFQVDAGIVSDGERIVNELLGLSRADAPALEALKKARARTMTWDRRACEALQSAP
jgi:hypothetical protein